MAAALATPWSLTDTVAVERRGPVAAVVDLARPGHGIAIEAPNGRAHDHLLGLDVGIPGDPELVDHWLRGRDVTGVYEPADARRLRATAMWRSLDDDAGIAAWEVVVSAQTSLLETDARVAVISSTEAASLAWATDAGAWQPWAPGVALPAAATRILARHDGTTLLVAVHPADARGITIEVAGARPRIACALFASAVEKGVLLRSRVLAALGPSAGADAWAARVSAAFAASPPPLTT